MNLSTNDFPSAVDTLLRDFGYEIGGDDDDGWAFHLGRPDSSIKGPHVDTASQASVSALKDLVIGTQDLLAASKAVLENWESGDLAASVRELSTCVRVLDPEERDHADSRRNAALDEQLAHRLHRLIAEGLDFGTCVRAFGVKADLDPIARSARLNYQREGEVEIDAYTVVSRGADCGAYVMAWLWIGTSSEQTFDASAAR